MRRAALAGIAVGMLATGMVGSAARAAIIDWDGSHWGMSQWTIEDAQPATLFGTLRHTGADQIVLVIARDGQDVPTPSCAAAGWSTPNQFNSYDTSSVPFARVDDFNFDMAPECNGNYLMHVRGQTTTDGYDMGTTVLTVSRPAPPVSGVAAKALADRSVTVSWNALDAAAVGTTKDITGFVVTRTDGAGHATSFTVADPAAVSYADKAVPASGGSFTYSVASTRYISGAGSSTAAKSVTVDKAPDTTTSSTTTSSSNADPGGGATTDPTNGTGNGGGTTGGGTAGGGGGGGGGSRSSGTRTGPAPVVQAVDPDQGFETKLPYEAEPGAVAASLPSGDENGGFAGAGVLVPFAVALLLGVWGILIHFVVKSARDTDEALALLHLELE